jgi:xylulose-5-phosphate/fructose-6-phosphate phosphoketolase
MMTDLDNRQPQINTQNLIDTASKLVAGDKGIYLKQQFKDKLIEHKQYIDKNGEDLPEIRNWKRNANK